jgi:glycosyltransferase involved in cell wall biosynthesis
MSPRVLHVVATGERRGAEVFAGDLVGALDGEIEQRVAILRAEGAPEVPYAAPVDMLAPTSRPLPGIRVDPRMVRRLRAIIEDWRPRVVQVHGGEPLKHALLARAGAPVVYRKIGLAAPRATRAPFRFGHERLIRRTSRIVAVAEAVRREAIDMFGAAEDRVVTIPNAVDPGRLANGATREHLRRELGIGRTEPVILSLGALTWEKDPLAHVEVAARAIRRVPGARHLIVGEGPLRADLEEAVDRAGLRGRVRLLGSRADVASLLRAADVLLLASRTEGMPGCVIEAGLIGTPTAGYAVAGLAEVVSDGETGLLASPGDVEGLSDRVVQLLNHEELRLRLGAAASERSRPFTIDRVAPRYAELYQDVAR